jgi:hypothetical protein
MKKLILASVVALTLAGSARPAEAKIFEVWGSGLAGYGWGYGDSSKDFFKWARGGAAGVEVGVKILFIGAYFDYLRYFGGDVGANLMTFNLGGDFDIKLVGGLSLVLRAAVGYMQATLPESQDTSFCDSNGICTRMANTRGIGIHGGPGLRYTFLKVLSVGCTPEIGWHYFFGGASTPITEGNSSGLDFNVLAYFRVGLGI